MTKKDTDLDIWMPLYIGDYLADTAHLSTEQHGAYLLLLMGYWKNRGPLPDNDALLARICKWSLRKWKLNRPVMSAFFQIDRGLWHQKRADEEIERSTRVKRARTSVGQAGAAARWGKNGEAQNDAARNAVGNASSMPQASKNDASSMHSHSNSNKDNPDRAESIAPPEASTPEKMQSLARQGCEILGVRMEDNVNRHTWPGAIKLLVDQGCDPEAHILQAFRVALDRDKGPNVNIGYISAVARSLRDDASKHAAPKAVAGGAAPATPLRDTHRVLVKLYRDRGIWADQDGPAPGTPGCRVDADILAEFGFAKVAA